MVYHCFVCPKRPSNNGALQRDGAGDLVSHQTVGLGPRSGLVHCPSTEPCVLCRSWTPLGTLEIYIHGFHCFVCPKRPKQHWGATTCWCWLPRSKCMIRTWVIITPHIVLLSVSPSSHSLCVLLLFLLLQLMLRFEIPCRTSTVLTWRLLRIRI